MENIRVTLWAEYRKYGTVIPRGAKGHIRNVNVFTGAVAIHFDRPFDIGNGETATGYTFTGDEFRQFAARGEFIYAA